MNNIYIYIRIYIHLWSPSALESTFQAVSIYDWNRYCVCSYMTWQRLTPGRLHADLWFPMARAAQVRRDDFSESSDLQKVIHPTKVGVIFFLDAGIPKIGGVFGSFERSCGWPHLAICRFPKSSHQSR